MRLRIACWSYDRIAPLVDGRVTIDGAEVDFTIASPHGFFFRTGEAPAFDVMEQSLSSYLSARSRGPTPFTAIPVYPSRMFRHSAIYIRTDRGISEPTDLKGRRIGIPYYGITAAMTARGILSDEYGVAPSDMTWVNGGLEYADARIDRPLEIAGVEIEQALGKSLSRMLEDGDIDGLITAAWPSCYRRRAENVGRLFPDIRSVEREYFARTGIFPIMHVVGIRTAFAEEHPAIAVGVYRAFCAAKAVCMTHIGGEGGAVMASLPFMIPDWEQTVALMGEDYWPYGIDRNRDALEAAIRWSYEQGLSARRLEIEDLFVPGTLDDSLLADAERDIAEEQTAARH